MLGPIGAGKSTLMRIMAGVEKDYKSPVGVTMIDGNSVSVAAAAPGITTVAGFNLAEHITPLETAGGNNNITPPTTVPFGPAFRARQLATSTRTTRSGLGAAPRKPCTSQDSTRR